MASPNAGDGHGQSQSNKNIDGESKEENKTQVNDFENELFQRKPTYKNAREYAQALRPWLDYQQMQSSQFHSNSMNMSMMAFQMQQMQNLFSMSSCFYPPFSPQVSPSSTHQNLRQNRADPYAHRRPNFNEQNANHALGNDRNQPNNDAGNGEGVRLKIPTFWKRVAAELIDFTFLFYIKMIISLSLMSEFNLDYISMVSGEDIIDRFHDLDFDKAFAITFEVIALEIINRVLITIFETMCLSRARAHGRTTGATPGKRLMGLRVVSCDSIQPLDNGYVLVNPAGFISVKNAFLRSVIKNFTIAFFLPACLTLFFFKHNRTAYDVVAHTVVVEDA